MGRIIHVELTATDLDRAAAFYATAFGWTTEASPFVGGYLVASTGPGDGIDGAIMTRDYQQQPAIPWIAVEDLDAALNAVADGGGAVASDPQELPGVGRLAYVRDPDGNLLGVRQPAG
ncbi:VOC family protein [Kribbella sp. NPDC050124]|uniref:VOC family protein n=1 Tax=Kribbella sp. NPDC050124 TaxID=3364114 RepID=UPI0037A4358C